MSSVKYNVGTFEGLNGVAIIYLGETASGGSQFLTYKVVDGGAEKFVFMSKSSAQSEMAKSKLVLSSNVDLSKIAEAVPAGILVGGFVNIDNGDDLPRLSTGQGFYSLAGEGIADYKADVGTPVTGKDGGGSTVLVTTAAKTLSETMSEGVTWISKNPIPVFLIVIVLLEVFGVTHIMEALAPKKKKARARR